ncbi:hypothetical protein [Streptomyces sp. Je 1-332]
MRETFERTGASVMGKRMFDAASSLARRSALPHAGVRADAREA